MSLQKILGVTYQFEGHKYPYFSFHVSNKIMFNTCNSKDMSDATLNEIYYMKVLLLDKYRGGIGEGKVILRKEQENSGVI